MRIRERSEGRVPSLRVVCRLLGFSRQAYHKRRRREERRAIRSELVIQQVIRIRTLQKRIGARKLHHMLSGFLSEHRIEMGRDHLYDLLRENRLLVRKRRLKKPRTTVSLPFWRYPNLIREFVPTRSGQLWVSDITYVRAGGGFAYLSLVTDAYSRKIVGHCLCRDLSARGCVAALKMAIRNNPERDHLIHHSDRGLQYHSAAYLKVLGNRTRISMSEKGDPLENAIAERVNGILKDELLEKEFRSFSEARVKIDEAVMIYNELRPHLSIDMLTPQEAHQRSGELKRLWKNYFSRRVVSQASA